MGIEDRGFGKDGLSGDRRRTWGRGSWLGVGVWRAGLRKERSPFAGAGKLSRM